MNSATKSRLMSIFNDEIIELECNSLVGEICP